MNRAHKTQLELNLDVLNSPANSYQIVDAQFFELKHDASEIRSQDFRVRVVLHLIFVSFLGVEPEAFAGPRAPGSAGSLLRGCFADRRDEK